MSQEMAPGVNPDTAAQAGGESNSNASVEAWTSSLPEDMRSNPSLTKYDSVVELAKGHVNAVQLLGKDKIPLPKSDAEFLDVYRQLGMPNLAEDYKFIDKEYGVPETLYSKESIKADQDMYRTWAHEVGLSQKQAETLYDKFMGKQAESLKATDGVISQEMHMCGEKLREAWGESRDTNIAIANRAMNKIFGPDVTEAITASGLGRNPAFIQGLHKLGLQSLEELGIDKRGNSTRTPEQLNDEISQLQAHPSYFDKSHPEHRQTVARVTALMQRRFPEVSGNR